MSHATHHRRRAGLAAALLLIPAMLLAACSDDGGEATTTQPTTTTIAATTTAATATSAVPTTAPSDTTVPQVDLLAGLLWGLPNTQDIGGGWVDQGRMIVPTEAAGEGFGAGLLCPEGQALAAPIGSALNDMVFTSYERPGSPRVRVSLLLGHEADLTEAFGTAVTALTACFDRDPWDMPDLGSLRMHALDMPALGRQSIAYYAGPGTTPGSDPWVEFQLLNILVAELDPSNDYSVVINVQAITVHDPAGPPVEMLDQAEIARIAELVVDRFAYDA